MKKSFILLLTAFLFLSLFVSCGPDPIVEITIRFDGNGNTGGQMVNQTVIAGDQIELNKNGFVKSGGYDFVGWNTKADGSGTMYPDGDTVRFKENTTLYAQWDIDAITIIFDPHDGTGLMAPQLAKRGVETTLSQNKYSREGYFFTGWNTKADGTGDSYSDSDTAKFMDNTTLHAQWHTDVVKITFDDNGGSGLMFPQWVNKNEETALKPNRFSWKGYFFMGWNTQKDGNGDTYNDKEKITAAGDITLYAQWAKDLVAMDQKAIWNAADSKYYSFSDDLTIDERVYAVGDVILFLPEGKTLTVSDGITVAGTDSLTINGGTGENAGTLKANPEGSYSRTGIGGDTNSAYAGTVIINGGNIYAKGGTYGAGIGGENRKTSGTVIINGGTVTAIGGRFGAGIGGGREGYIESITISGGTVYAIGGERCNTGIGGGASREDKGTVSIGSDLSLFDKTDSDWTKEDLSGGSYTDRKKNVLVAESNTSTPVILFNPNGGQTVNPAYKTVTKGSNYGTLPVPEPTAGYTFTGWYTESSGGTKIQDSTTVETTAPQILYAQWAL